MKRVESLFQNSTTIAVNVSVKRASKGLSYSLQLIDSDTASDAIETFSNKEDFYSCIQEYLRESGHYKDEDDL